MDTFLWDWEYRKVRRGIDPLFIVHGVAIRACPNHPECDLEDQDICLLVSSEHNEKNIANAYTWSSLGAHVMTLGDIPSGFSEREILDDLKNMALNCEKRTFDFFPAYETIPFMTTHCFLWVSEDETPIIAPWHVRSSTSGNIQKTLKALERARQARFEWGQNG